MIVYPDAAEKNFDMMGGLMFSQRVLLALTQAGASREKAYAIVQRNAMKVWDEGGQLKDYLVKDSDVTKHLKSKELNDLFDMNYHTKHVNTIFKRVFDEV